MPRFRVVVIGTGMTIPHEGFVGFVTTRFVRCADEAEASVRALELVSAAAAAEEGFRESPGPSLTVDRVYRVRSPFKLSRPNKGYTFIGSDADVESALELERSAGDGWFM